MTSNRSILVAAALVAGAGAGAGPARADDAKLRDALAPHTFALSVQRGALAGKGAPVLRQAIDDATFVMLGEDHGIEQVPSLAAALCAELAPHGLHRVALEVGPSVAPALERMAAARDGAAQLAAFGAKYPDSIAFYDWREDFAFLSACAKATAAQKQPLEVWGVDQELMGAAGLVLDRILATKPGAEATTAVTALRDQDAGAHADATKSGDFGKLFLMSAAQADLDAAAALLAKQGTAEAQGLFASLLRSRAIYQGQMTAGASPYDSNRERARLMKEQFLDHVSAAAGKDKAMPKVLVKLGAWHLYRGLNPLRSAELGNLIGEAAEGHRVRAVNVLVLGVAGKQLAVAAPGKAAPVALDLRAKDSPYAFLTPFFASQQRGAWTLFDLRPLRADVAALGELDREMERLIFGYDFLVLIADPRPEHAR